MQVIVNRAAGGGRAERAVAPHLDVLRDGRARGGALYGAARARDRTGAPGGGRRGGGGGCGGRRWYRPRSRQRSAAASRRLRPSAWLAPLRDGQLLCARYRLGRSDAGGPGHRGWTDAPCGRCALCARCRRGSLRESSVVWVLGACRGAHKSALQTAGGRRLRAGGVAHVGATPTRTGCTRLRRRAART